MRKKNIVGMIGELTEKQNSDREYFSEIPIGTKFIIIGRLKHMMDNTSCYDIRSYFLYIEPQIRNNKKLHFTGYIEKGTWKLLGTSKDFFLDNKNL
jgi:hypothetical protein